MRKATQVPELGDDGSRRDEVDSAQSHQCIDHGYASPGLYLLTKRSFEPFDALGPKAHGQAVLGEGDVMGRVVKLDPREKQLVLWPPASAGIRVSVAKQE